MRENLRTILYRHITDELPPEIKIFYENIPDAMVKTDTVWVQLSVLFDQPDEGDLYIPDSLMMQGQIEGSIGIPHGTGASQLDRVAGLLEAALSRRKLEEVQTGIFKTAQPFSRPPCYCLGFSVAFLALVAA